jgi:hypothetical protein
MNRRRRSHRTGSRSQKGNAAEREYDPADGALVPAPSGINKSPGYAFGLAACPKGSSVVRRSRRSHRKRNRQRLWTHRRRLGR